MNELKSFVPTRVLVDITRAIALSGETALICVDKGVLQIIRLFLEGYGKRVVNFYNQLTPGGYYTPTTEQWDTVQDMIDGFLGDNDMSCEDLTHAIMSLANAARSGGGNCCQPGTEGLNGAGGQQQGGNEFYDTGANFPQGFDDRAAFLDYKCQKAFYLMNQVNQDLERASVVAVVGMTLSSLLVGLGVVLITPIPFDDLVYLAIAIISILGTVGLFASAIEEARNLTMDTSTLCILYCGPGANETKDQLHNYFIDASSAIAEPPRELVRQILFTFWNTDVINSLFINDGKAYTGSDCSTCDCTPGTCSIAYSPTYHPTQLPAYPGGTIQSQSLLVTGHDNQGIRLTLVCELDQEMTVTDFDLPTPNSTTFLELNYLDINGNNQVVNLLLVALPFVVTVANNSYLWVTSQSHLDEFTVDVTFQDA